MLFWRYTLALAVLIPLAIATSPSLRDDWTRAGRGLFINGMTFGILQTYTYFRAVETVPSSVVITVFFTYPALTLLIDRYIYRLTITLASVIAVVFIFIGAMLAGWPNLSFTTTDPVGLACVIATPLFFSIYIAIAYRFTRQASPFAAAASIYGGLGTGYALIALLIGLKFPSDGVGWLTLLGIAILGGVIQISSFSYALPRLSTSGYSIIVSMELVTVVIVGVVVLGEHLSGYQIAGITLVVAGVIIDRLLRGRR